MSTNSDPNDSSVSLLARISAKRTESNTSGLATPVELNKNPFQYTRPNGKLRVDTAVPTTKQNKSAYPTFTSNGILLPAGDQTPSQEPAPVTAGPDLGRQHNARLEIVGFNNVSIQTLVDFEGHLTFVLSSKQHPKRPQWALASAIPSMEQRSISTLLRFPLELVTHTLCRLVVTLHRHTLLLRLLYLA
jgi:hypothetical protein